MKPQDYDPVLQELGKTDEPVLEVMILIQKDDRYAEGLNKITQALRDHSDGPIDAAEMLSHVLAHVFAISLKPKDRTKEKLDNIATSISNAVYVVMVQMLNQRHNLNIPDRD